jgi:hypothetical protein
VILILLPTIAAACTVAVTQSRLYERYQLRVTGQRVTQTLYYSGCQRFAQASTPKEYSDIHADLVSKLDAIDAQQGDGFFAFILGATSTSRPKDAALDQHSG